MKTKFFTGMMLAALFISTGAFAQEQEKHEGDGRGEMFKKLDTNNDGKISMAEAEKAPKGKLKEHFAAIDTNKDSYIDKEEMKAFVKARKQARPKKQK